MMVRRIMFSLAFLAASLAVADTVYLKSGSTLKGTVAGTSGGEVVFNSDDLGEIKIPLANIVKLENAGTHVLRYHDDRRETRQLSVKDGAYLADGQAIDTAELKEIDPKVDPWHGSVYGAYLAQRGNTFENSWSIYGDVSKKWEYDRFAGNVGYYYTETGTGNGADRNRTTDRWEAQAQHDHFWVGKFFGFERVRYERDMIKNLQARYMVGIGPGYQWLDGDVFETTGKWTFRQDVEILWEKEEYRGESDAKKNGFAALAYTHHLGYVPKWYDNVEFFHNAKYNPQVDDFDKYLLRADVGLTAKLIGDFALNARIEWDYDSKPACDRKKSDVRYIAGLGYKW